MPGSKRDGVVIQDRDRHLLSEMDVMRIVDRDMVQTMGGFDSPRRTNRRLLKLTRAGLLRRFFVGSIAYGRKSIYTLSGKGVELVNAKFGGISRPAGRLVVSDKFVEHQSRINEIYLAVKYKPLPLEARFARWHIFRRSISEAAKITPDAYFEIATGENIRAMFLEVDLGTEALKVWQQKTTYYLQLAVSGEFTKRFRQQQFRVLVIANSDRRLANIRATVAKSTDKVFWFSTLDNTHRDGIWSPIWLRPQGDRRYSLL
jgi:hypothetical protein